MKKGFTLTELLIVVAILLILFLLLLINIQGQINKANDAKRKTDLDKIQKAFEEYYNDNQCYPANSPIGNCGSADLSPYMRTVPCDPTTRKPYKFIAGTPTACDGYHVCAKLQNLSDPDITRIGCDPVQGCGWGAGYNYCVSIGSIATAPNGGGGGGGSGGSSGGGGIGTPTPTPKPGKWACTRRGRCDQIADPSCNGGSCCPRTYDAFGCVYNGVNQCDDHANWCTN